ncbi:(2Fe-2S)-binding protein [Streptomyces sp. NPDC057336]|uniref:(2Fe-2S)-binding protein n=1 Tax=Streptomyces sp. NPDC057336 TaxID=3346102 RepID=UPI00363A4872
MVLLLPVAPTPDLDPGLTALRPLGGFFLLHASRPAPSRPLPTLADAYAPGDGAPGPSPRPRLATDPLGFRVRKVAAALRVPETRVAASVAQQGLAARLWSVTLGCAALHGRVPDLAPRLLHYDPDAAAPDDLWLSGVSPLPGDAGTIADTVLRAHLVPLTAAVHDRYRVATGLLWGNAASALAGAGRELDRWARRNGRTDTADRARALTAELLAHPLLARAGTLTGTAFRRRSCCLYYRVPGSGVCGDCCFSRPPEPPRSPPPSSPSSSSPPPSPDAPSG